MTFSPTFPGVQRYTHTQNTAASTWTVTHNLNTLQPLIDTFIVVDGAWQTVLPDYILYPDANTVTIHWTTAYAGSARLIA